MIGRRRLDEPPGAGMKVLVVGASGLVGGAVMRTLERCGIEAVGTARSEPLDGLVPLDVTDAAAVARCLEALRPTVIVVAVNAAGGVDYCQEHPEDAYALNVEGTRHLVDAARRHGARVVYYSTDYVFDGAHGPYAEDDTPAPLSVYGRTKWEAEQVVQSSAPRSLILRTTAVYGWNRRSKNFAMQLWQQLQTGRRLPVPHDQWCNPTLADYLAEASVRLIEMEAEGIVNVVGKDRMARSELAAALARAMALDPSLLSPVSTQALGRPAPRPLQGGLTTDKLERLLGTAPLTLQESLKRFQRQWRAETHVRYTPGAVSDEAARVKHELLQGVRRYYALAHQPKPFVPYKTRIQYAGRVFAADDLVQLVESALDFWLTLGPYGEQFEQTMKRLFGAKDVVLVNSGSTANLTAVLTLLSKQLERPLRAGDEVITPAVTFPTTLAPLVHSGLIPVFVDAEVGTYNINPHLIEGALSDKTRALMIPHTLGNPCDLEIISALVKRHELYLIEDCCDALGATFEGRWVGTFGHLATLSFFPAHQMTTGEGGAVVVNAGRLSRIARSVRDWGRDCWCAPGESNTCGKRFGWQLGDLPRGYDHKYTYTNLGYNFKPTDLQAAIGVAQAGHLSEFLAQRRRNFLRLYRALEPYQDRLVLPRWDPRSNPSWFGFPITVKQGGRDELVQWLESANIETRGVFAGNILRQPGYADIRCRVHGELTQSDRIMRETLFVGVYPGLTDEMLDFMIQRFEAFFAQAAAGVR